jgi:hypothetical protein
MPVLDRAAATAKGVEDFWPVAINAKELVYVSTTAAAPYPPVRRGDIVTHIVFHYLVYLLSNIQICNADLLFLVR